MAPTAKPTFRRRGLMVGSAPSDKISDAKASSSRRLERRIILYETAAQFIVLWSLAWWSRLRIRTGRPDYPLAGELAGHVLRDLTTPVAVLGGCLYALIALAYERFYRVLGIAPKDVGIAPGAIVARTAVALAIFVAVGGATYFTCFAVLSIVLPRSTPGTTALAALAVVAVLGPLVIAASIAEVLLSGPFLVITGLLAVVLLAASLGTIWVLRRRPSPRGRVAVVAVWAAVLAFFSAVGWCSACFARMAWPGRSWMDGRSHHRA